MAHNNFQPVQQSRQHTIGLTVPIYTLWMKARRYYNNRIIEEPIKGGPQRGGASKWTKMDNLFLIWTTLCSIIMKY